MWIGFFSFVPYITRMQSTHISCFHGGIQITQNTIVNSCTILHCIYVVFILCWYKYQAGYPCKIRLVLELFNLLILFIGFLVKKGLKIPKGWLEALNRRRMVWFMVFNATFKNTSVISWRSVLLVEETADLPQVTDWLVVA